MNAITRLSLLRPLQWVKNLMIFFPPFLSGSLLSHSNSLQTSMMAFLSFSLVSSSMYVYNDLSDLEKDALHPVKRLRPLPSGAVSRAEAAIIAMLLGTAGVGLAALTVRPLIPYLLIYCAVTISYTRWLKRIPLVDLFCISSGFLIRLYAGGEIFKVQISEWLFLSVFFLSIFLSAGKRLAEISLLGSGAAEHRSCLTGYSSSLLEVVLIVSASTSLLTYTMYTLTHPRLVYSVPLCTLGLFRYVSRIKEGCSGDPTESLFKDIPLLCISVIWASMVSWSIYL